MFEREEPEFIGKLAGEVHALIRRYDAMDYFRKKLQQWRGEHADAEAKQDAWNERRRKYYLETVPANPRLSDKGAGPLEEAPYWVRYRVPFEDRIADVTLESADSMPTITFNDKPDSVCAWTPMELLDAEEPEVRLPVLVPQDFGPPALENMTLAEKYAALSGLHDVWWPGDPIGPSDEPYPDEQDAMPRFKDALLYESLKSELKGSPEDARYVAFYEDVLKDVEADLEDRKPGGTNGKGKRRGRKKADYKIEQREAELAAEWKRAKENGVYKADFAQEHKMTQKDFDKLLNRVTKRNARSDN